MKKYLRFYAYFIALALLTAATYGQAPYKSLDERVPLDPTVITGTLSNGMKYFIKQNKKPEKRAELMLAVDAGATLEDDDQNGLAHLCEHMAFNGTKNFPKTKLIDYLESIGVSFGRDLNAFTSYEQTVYMLTIPTDNPEHFKNGMQVIDDWSHAVSYEDEEINKERGVVIEEYRLGKGAEDRCNKKHEKVLYRGSRYEIRDVIGDTNVLRNTPEAALRRFYHDWYRPNLMAVIAVGDFDPKVMEKEIKKRFSSLKNPDSFRERKRYEIPPHSETLVSIARDKELSWPDVSIYFRRPYRTLGDYRDERLSLASNLMSSMLNERLAEINRKPTSPFNYYAYNWESNSLGKTREYVLMCNAKGDKVKEALETLLTEANRAKQHGFTATELERQKKEYMRNAEKAVQEADKTESQRYAFGLMSVFLYKTAMMGEKKELEMAKLWLPEITLDEVNAIAKEYVTDKNVVITMSAPDRPDVKLPTEAEALAMFRTISGSNLTAYNDDAPQKPLFTANPAPGKIANEREIKSLGVTEWTLDNGAKIILKPTDYQNNEILFQATSPGGYSLANENDLYSARYASQIVQESGLGDYTKTQLEKYLAGKIVNLSSNISELQEGLRGSSSQEDLETLFQMINLKFTAPRIDKEAYESTLAKTTANIQNRLNDPETAMNDTLTCTLYCYNNRRKPMELGDVPKIDMTKAYQFYKERFAGAGDFNFYFVGNFDVEKIKPYVLKYLGSLPPIGKNESFKDNDIKLVKGKLNKEVHKGIENKGSVVMTLTGDFDWKPENRYKMESLVDALDILLYKVIREEKSGTYGVSVYGGPTQKPKKQYTINVWFGCDPARINELTQEVMTQFKKVKESGLDELYVTKVKEKQRRSLQVDMKENRTWMGWIASAYWNDDDPSWITDREKYIDKLTKDDLKKAANEWLNTDNMVQVVLYPEIKTE